MAKVRFVHFNGTLTVFHKYM